MEVAACNGYTPPVSDARAALCASPALSEVPPAPCPLPAAFLPPAMTLAELTALATGDPDALKAFVDGQPSSAVAAAGTLSRGQALRDAVALRRTTLTPRCARHTAVMSPSTQTDGSPLQSDLATPSADGSSPNGGSPGKRRGPRSSTSKFRGVSCYKRCVTCLARACVSCAY